jgi:RNA recognition motif-containing protein
MSNSNTIVHDSNGKCHEYHETKERKLCIPDYLAQALCEQNTNSIKQKKSSLINGNSSNGHVEALRTLCVQNLPEWTTEYDLKSLLSRSSSVALEFSLKTGATADTNRFIKHIDIVRNNETGNCVGYAYVEFFNHASASELLTTLSETNVYFPGSNK